jgi:serine/threonine-protein kinase RsbW
LDKQQTMNTTRVSYTLESTLESVDKAEQAAAEVAAKCCFDADECGRITMAVREATVNAVLHGNHYNPAKRVTVSFETAPNALTIVVCDEGAGLDPATVPDPLSPENLLKQSGRGIFLIRSFMDEVHFRSNSPGTELSMIKFMPGQSGDSANEGNL